VASSFDDVLLAEVARAAQSVRLECVLIGNAAAALLGAPVTSVDLDFFIRDTRQNEAKLERLAEALGGLAVTRPGEPTSRMVRLLGKPAPLDFVIALSSGARFEAVRARATDVDVGGVKVRVASLADVIAAKRAAGRPKDLAVLPLLEQTARVLDAMNGTPGKPRRSR
jgi:predicted nucleotidyltransferase